MPVLLKSFLKILSSHYQAQIKLMEKIARYSDESVSKTINLSKPSCPDDISKIFMYAYELDLKGITVFRDHCLDERKIKKLKD